MSNELISDIRMLIVGNYSMAIGSTEAANEIAEKCRDTAIEAILSLPARNLTRQQAIQVINKAFNDNGE